MISDPHTTNEQDRSNFDRWSAQNLDKMLSWAGEAEDYTYRLCIFGIFAMLHWHATKLQSEYQQAWAFNYDEVKKMIASDPTTKIRGVTAERLFASMEKSFNLR